jgi:mannose-6-phosphate isomerase-like protein (cupin superfamily)
MTETRRPTTPSAHVSMPGPDRSAWYAGWHVEFIATGEDTGGHYSLTGVHGRRDHSEMPPLHVHTREEECFYVLSGTITCYVGDEVFELAEGGFIALPPNVPHRYEVTSGEARLLNLCLPAGFEGFYRALSEPPAGPGFPPKPDGPRDIPRLIAVAAEHGIEIVGPPPATD